MKYTDEQIAAIDTAKLGKTLKIEAFAGAGKTTTLKAVAENLKGRGLYTAFNRGIVEDAKKKMPCESRTFNSLAFKDFGKQFGGRVNAKLPGYLIAQQFNIANFMVKNTLGKTKAISGNAIGSLALATVRNFCQTTDSTILPYHAFISPDDFKGIQEGHLEAVKEQAYEYAKRLWPLMSNVDSDFPSDHCVYCKLFADSDPVLGYDYILFDEAQDADRLMLSVMEKQDTQLIWVGDEFQQIYSWRGAVNAMRKIETDETVSLTQSFRFGEVVADFATGIIKQLGSKKIIKGNPAVDSKLAKLDAPGAILCRTNASVAAELFNVPQGIKVATTGLQQSREFFNNYKKLASGQKATGSYALFDTVGQLREHAESPSGADLKPYFKMLEDHSIERILQRFGEVKEATQITDEVKRDYLIISTAHKSKGLEYHSVRLSEDFRTPSDAKSMGVGEKKPMPPTDEQIRLYYVAATRAIEVLDPFKTDVRFLGNLKPTPQICFEDMKTERERLEASVELQGKPKTTKPAKQTKPERWRPKKRFDEIFDSPEEYEEDFEPLDTPEKLKRNIQDGWHGVMSFFENAEEAREKINAMAEDPKVTPLQMQLTIDGWDVTEREDGKEVLVFTESESKSAVQHKNETKKVAENPSNLVQADERSKDSSVRVDFQLIRKEAMLDVRSGMSIEKALLVHKQGLSNTEQMKLRASLEAVASTMK